jgi:hypothetical protein
VAQKHRQRLTNKFLFLRVIFSIQTLAADMMQTSAILESTFAERQPRYFQPLSIAASSAPLEDPPTARNLVPHLLIHVVSRAGLYVRDSVGDRINPGLINFAPAEVENLWT